MDTQKKKDRTAFIILTAQLMQMRYKNNSCDLININYMKFKIPLWNYYHITIIQQHPSLYKVRGLQFVS